MGLTAQANARSIASILRSHPPPKARYLRLDHGLSMLGLISLATASEHFAEPPAWANQWEVPEHLRQTWTEGSDVLIPADLAAVAQPVPAPTEILLMRAQVPWDRHLLIKGMAIPTTLAEPPAAPLPFGLAITAASGAAVVAAGVEEEQYILRVNDQDVRGGHIGGFVAGDLSGGFARGSAPGGAIPFGIPMNVYAPRGAFVTVHLRLPGGATHDANVQLLGIRAILYGQLRPISKGEPIFGQAPRWIRDN